MKKILYIASALAFIACGASKDASKEDANVDQAAKYAATITAKELSEHLYIYASDEFEGRETGEPGQKKAIEYLKKQYVSLKIPSPISKDDYFQEVPLMKQENPEINFTVGDKSFKIGDDLVSVLDGSDATITESEIIYVGFGIENEKYSNYKDIDVKDKVVLIKEGEPKIGDSYMISGTNESSKWSTREQYGAKREVAIAKGAKAILFFSPEIYPMISEQYGKSSSRMSLKNNKESDKMFYFFVNASMAKTILPTIDTDSESKAIKTPISFTYKERSKEFTSENVVAFIKGTEKPDEILVISAHLDHEGIKDGEIYNGADDDGSGTVALLEIAEAFKMASNAGKGPKRSILFLHVTGEEKGLLGSSHYTDIDPIFPLENTIADLNVDMIGRTDPERKSENRNYIYLIGSDKLSTELHTVSEEVNKKYTNIELDYTYNDENDPNRFYYRSDHYNFAKNNVPVIFYFNGTHDDYHQPSDTPDKIEYDLLENRTRLVFHTAWELANRENRIVVDKAEKKE
ncbi:M28 family peptidase [Polaribacter glomeratus]|uniref:Peptidase n=1 Tax=Polaribacter glomeratus TaxID=102 RepID=A0A2S7WWY7_9FLAO|nr:M28 family peptidase [Polaribacter glomeratus]PQJ82119.1 peptidase [Polaribacter glomeratus]TXD66713.1 M28 family peptidase [Polaribacter glomeratus]